MNKINKTVNKCIKTIKDKKPNKKKHTVFMIALVLFFLTGIYSTGHYYNNYLAYETLSDIRDEVDLSHYKDNNYLVKNATLNNMKEEVDQRVEDLITGYKKTVPATEEFDNAIEEVVTDQPENLSKYGELENVVKEDLIKRVDQKQKDIKNIKIDLDDLTEQESAKYEELSKEIDAQTTSGDLEALYNTYEKQTNLEQELNSLNESIDDRKTKEAEEKAQKEAEEKAQKEAEEEAQKEAEESLDFSGLESNLAPEGSFNRAVGENLFNAVNAYRSHLGLTPYTYNSSMQSCVDQESQAYGTNGNPHNWLCPVSNENASNAPVGSDAVQISMNFFMTDPPHEAVLSGDYTSATTSVYESGGTSYIILCVF